MKKYITFFILLFIFSIISVSAFADGSSIGDLAAISVLNTYIHEMVKNVKEWFKRITLFNIFIKFHNLHNFVDFYTLYT